MLTARELSAGKPRLRKLFCTIPHVLSAEHSECKHLLRRELWPELRIEVLPFLFGEEIGISLLHLVVHNHLLRCAAHTYLSIGMSISL